MISGGQFDLRIDITNDDEGSWWRLLAVETLRDDADTGYRYAPEDPRLIEVARQRVGPAPVPVERHGHSTRERMRNLLRRAVPAWEG